MSGEVNSVYDFQEIDIYTKVILGKKNLAGLTILWQEKYENGIGTGLKEPLRLYFINDGCARGSAQSPGSPVKSVKLCKRMLAPEYPRNTLVLPGKSKVSHRFSIVLLVEFENGNFNVITIPKQIVSPKSRSLQEQTVFCSTLFNDAGLPAPQQQSRTEPNESLVVVTEEATGCTAFEYRFSLPLNEILTSPPSVETDDQGLQSFIQVKNLKFNAEIQEPHLLETEQPVWTTAVDIALTEDIIIKIGIDQDIVVRGISGS